MESAIRSFKDNEFVKKYNVVLKLLYLFLSLAYYSCHTFRMKYLKKEFGIEKKDYGLIAALLALVSFGAGYFWSYLADKYRKPKLFLMISLIVSGLSFQFFLIELDIDDKPKVLSFTACISAIYLFFNSSLMILLDVVALNMLGKENRELYGRQRLWGSIGYAIISYGVGYIVEDKARPYLNIVLICVSIIAAFLAYVLIPDDPKRNQKDHDNHKKDEEKNHPVHDEAEKTSNSKSLDDNENVKKGWKNWDIVVLLSKGPFLFLLLIVFMNGLPRAFMTQFLQPIQEVAFKTPTWVTGITTGTGVLFEIVIFFYSKSLIAFFGLNNMLLIAQFFMSVRCILYGFTPTTFDHVRYVPIYYELLKGLSFGFMQSAGVQLTLSLAPTRMKATAQAIYNGVFTGISAFVSGMLVFILECTEDGKNKDSPIDKKKDAERYIKYVRLMAYVSIAAFFLFLLKSSISSMVTRTRNKNSNTNIETINDDDDDDDDKISGKTEKNSHEFEMKSQKI